MNVMSFTNISPTESFFFLQSPIYNSVSGSSNLEHNAFENNGAALNDTRRGTRKLLYWCKQNLLAVAVSWKSQPALYNVWKAGAFAVIIIKYAHTNGTWYTFTGNNGWHLILGVTDK